MRAPQPPEISYPMHEKPNSTSTEPIERVLQFAVTSSGKAAGGRHDPVFRIADPVYPRRSPVHRDIGRLVPSALTELMFSSR